MSFTTGFLNTPGIRLISRLLEATHTPDFFGEV